MFTDFDVHEKSNVIAILQTSQDGTKKINTYDLETRQLTGEINNEYIPQGPRLSPSGKQLAFFTNDNPLFLWNIKQNSVTTIFDEPHLYAGFVEWSNDGKQICFSAYSIEPNKKTPPDIYSINLESLEVNQLTNSKGVDRFPQWSPSNQYVAYHRQHLHEPNTPKKIYIFNTNTKVCDFIPHIEGSYHRIGRYCWSRDSTQILINETSKSGSLLKIFCISDMNLVQTFSYPEVLGGAFLPKSDDILIVCKNELVIASSKTGELLRKINLPDDIAIQQTIIGPSIALNPSSNYIYFLNELSCIYRVDYEGSIELLFKDTEEKLPNFKHQEYIVISRDKRNIPVHCFTPDNPKNTGVLLVHGGPGETVNSPNDPLIIRLLEEGYEVIVPAYRGCSGYGQEHKEANHGEYGRADVWDILAAGADWKIKTGNSRPLAIMGYSYGGFLTMLSLTYTDVSWDYGISLWGGTRIEHLGLHLPRAYPVDPIERAIAEKERNPLEQANKIKTPLLIIHGGKDTTSTNEEVQFIQQQVQIHGGVCDLIIYDDDTHGLPKHRQEMFKQILTFLGK
ncbi:dipeptidyl aminopeptidase/acylaminoacyl peptidase [Paenibacillus sp. V4I3]|uniref:S9 family peptidase n=1 Tax=Paenibacillus sp. V4I3 TaxID=3042305 RepID=UPI002786860B|nr:alpha/beta fold hydrolase [Paenibacillus sp. V4I3]MDQ0878858.1 dipeptidyl aminopeptidase/acylaminoacyl peptidase [Paenibacillus sp. V4I3]